MESDDDEGRGWQAFGFFNTIGRWDPKTIFLFGGFILSCFISFKFMGAADRTWSFLQLTYKRWGLGTTYAARLLQSSLVGIVVLVFVSSYVHYHGHISSRGYALFLFCSFCAYMIIVIRVYCQEESREEGRVNALLKIEKYIDWKSKT